MMTITEGAYVMHLGLYTAGALSHFGKTDAHLRIRVFRWL